MSDESPGPPHRRRANLPAPYGRRATDTSEYNAATIITPDKAELARIHQWWLRREVFYRRSVRIIRWVRSSGATIIIAVLSSWAITGIAPAWIKTAAVSAIAHVHEWTKP